MTTAEIDARAMLEVVTPEQLTYAKDPERGDFCGFAALHDLFDANLILPEAETACANDPAWLERARAAIEAFDALILAPKEEA